MHAQYFGTISVRGATRCDEEAWHELAGSPEGWRTWGRPAGAPRTDWLRTVLAPGGSLADLYLYASPACPAVPEHMAQHAYRLSRPHDGGLTSPAGIEI